MIDFYIVALIDSESVESSQDKQEELNQRKIMLGLGSSEDYRCEELTSSNLNKIVDNCFKKHKDNLKNLSQAGRVELVVVESFEDVNKKNIMLSKTYTFAS